jgi:hypothetical protein
LQINLYGFTRLWRGKDRGGYYHEYFLRSRPHLLRFVRRIGKKASRASANPDTEPNFYGMAPIQPSLTQLERKELRDASEPATQPVAPPFDPEVIRHATLQEVAKQRHLQLHLLQLAHSNTLALNAAVPAAVSGGNVALYRAPHASHSLYEHTMEQQILHHHQLQQRTLRGCLLQMQMQQRRLLQHQMLSLTGISACNSMMRGSSGSGVGAAVPSLWDTSTSTNGSDSVEDIVNSSTGAAAGLDL